MTTAADILARERQRFDAMIAGDADALEALLQVVAVHSTPHPAAASA